MADAPNYETFRDDDLIELWPQRDELTAPARIALQDQLSARHLLKQAEEYRPPEPPKDNSARFAPPVETYLNISVLFWWLREIRLRARTRNGRLIEAKVLSTIRTRAGYRSAARCELTYSYELDGNFYYGRVVRDFMFGSDIAEELAFGHTVGQSIPVLVSREDPTISYYPSGFSSVQPIVFGSIGIFIACFLLWFAYILLSEHALK